MGLILKDKIPMFIAGYPTISDKYNCAGGILAGSTATEFGKVVTYSTTTGYYEAASGTIAVTDVAGLAVATNVKLADQWPGTTVTVKPGEAFNLLLDGYVAVELAATAVESNITPGAAVALTLAGGALTTHGVSGASDLTGYTFTGLYEKHGSTIVAEIRVK